MLARKRVLDGDTSAGASLTVPPSVPQDTTVEEGTLVEKDEDLQMAIQRSLITSKTEDDRRLIQDRYMAFEPKLTWRTRTFSTGAATASESRLRNPLSIVVIWRSPMKHYIQLFVVARDEYFKEAHGDKYMTVEKPAAPTVDTSSVS
jgi:hypothetical protein